jgi:sugar lactone lactonase YvrE
MIGKSILLVVSVLALVLLTFVPSFAQTGTITTYAGTVPTNLPATDVGLCPHSVSSDSTGNVYIASLCTYIVARVDHATHQLTTVAGNGSEGYAGDNGPATSASILPEAIALDAARNLFIADGGNVVRKVDSITGVITTVAGNGSPGFSGDNGPAISASLSNPSGLALDGAGNLFIGDAGNSRVRRVDSVTGVITTVAGNGSTLYNGDNIFATSAGILNPSGLALDTAGNLFIQDGNYRIRRVDASTHLITTVAGNGTPGDSGDNGPATSAGLALASFQQGIALDYAGNLFIAEFSNRVRRVDAVSGVITTVAGNGTLGYSGDNGPATSASLNYPIGVALDGAGDLFIAEWQNNRVRRVDAAAQVITTQAGNGSRGYFEDNGPATSSGLCLPSDVAVDNAGNLFIADQSNHRVRRVDASSKVITTVAGNGTGTYSGDNGPATAASLFYPNGIALDRAGNLFIADSNNYRVRRVDANTGVITTVTGNGSLGYSGDNGPATSASLYLPQDVALDMAGNLFIADESNHVRRVDATTGFITTVAGNGSATYNGDNILATGAGLTPSGISLDDAGNLFIADISNHRIRRVDATTELITTVAGNGAGAYSGDDGPATMASLNFPQKVTVDNTGDLFIADGNNYRVRRVDAVTQTITSAAGNGTPGFSGDEGSATSAMLNYPTGAVADRSGNLFIADTFNNRIRQVPLGTSGMSLSQNSINFGTVPVYSSQTVTVTISNTGNAAELFTVALSGSTTYTETDTCGTMVAPGMSCAVSTIFSPITLGAQTGTLNITSNVPGGAGVVTLSGQGTADTTTTTLTSSAIPSYLNQAVLFTAIVRPQFGGVPTGTITFLQGAKSVATAVLVNGQATYGVTYTTVGTRSITTVYSGDNNDLGETSAVLKQIVNSLPAATITKITTSGSPSLINQPVTFTAAVTSTYGPIPDGEAITFFDGATEIGTGMTASGMATLNFSPLTANVYTIKASYPGDITFKASSGTVKQLVNLNSSTTTVSSSPNPSTYGQAVGLRGTVTSGAPGGPTGTVTFKNGAITLGTTALNAGNALLAAAKLPTGTLTITATYNGDAQSGKSSGATTQTVNQATTTTALTSSVNPSSVGRTVKFTATVSSATTVPTGSVTFMDGSNVLGSANLAAGKTSYSTSMLSAGSHSITAVYNGTANIGGSASIPLMQAEN